jgi:solute carrier family 8 (sodium/calcium exchanger)
VGTPKNSHFYASKGQRWPETFFIKNSKVYNSDPDLKLGAKAICMVTIVDDDEPGEIGFKDPVHVVKESVGSIDVIVERKNGADGNVSVHYKTTDINAIAGRYYESIRGVLEFRHSEVKKCIQIEIYENFFSIENKQN